MIHAPHNPEIQPLLQDIACADRLGQLVRAQRKQQGLRIDDAAALSGVSVDMLSRLENGSGSVRLDKLMSVLDSLGLTLVLASKGHPLLHTPPDPAPQDPAK
jgi:transcriptional regulator with XRE-family HTH domain